MDIEGADDVEVIDSHILYGNLVVFYKKVCLYI